MVLGAVQARANGELIALGPRLRRLVLATLLLEANKQVPIERLVSLLWGDHQPASARNSVHGHVSQLRRELARHGAKDDGVQLLTIGTSYLLRVDPLRIDAHRFRDLVARAAEAGDDHATVALLREALGLWRGDLMSAAALDETRARYWRDWEEARLVALEDCLDAELRIGRHRAVLAELTGLASAHPARERFIAQLMLALYRCSGPSESMAAYRRARVRLAEDYGLDPGRELQRLASAVLRGDPSLESPAHPVLSVVPRQLPADSANFTGRVDSLSRLDTLLGGKIRVGAIVGTAGVGKTALALRWAHRMRDSFQNGQLYIDLGGFSRTPAVEPGEALARFIRALGVPPQCVPRTEQERAALYRSLMSGKRMIVVLDNARGTEQVRSLLPADPAGVVLVTSRDRMDGLVGMHDALRVDLDVLPEDDAVSLLERVAGPDRVGAGHAASRRLAQLCGRLPLALRIVASHLASRPDASLAGVISELESRNRIAWLSIPGEPGSSVRAAFDQSYAALPSGAAVALRRIGIAPGLDFTARAAAALLGTTIVDAEERLAALAHAHLAEQNASGRLHIHDLVRQYASLRADADDSRSERDEALHRLFTWYLTSTDRAMPVLFPGFLRLSPTSSTDPPGQTASVDSDVRWLECERPALVSVIEHAAAHGPHPVAWRLADALRAFFWLHGHHADWLRTAEAGMHAARRDGDLRAVTAMHHNLGHACRQLKRHPRAIRHFRRSLAGHRELGWREGEATTLGNLGITYGELGDHRRAIHLHETALALHRETNSLGSEAIALNNLGDMFREIGELDRAVERHLEALRVSRQVRSGQGQAQALMGLAATYVRLGLDREAIRNARLALETTRRTGQRLLEGPARTVLIHANRSATPSTTAASP